MSQIIDLISRICASGPRASLRASADVALPALASQFANLATVLFERDGAQAGSVSVTSGVNIPALWRARSVSLSEIPFVRDAFDTPERIVVSTLHVHACGTPSSDAQKVQVVCGAVTARGEAMHSVALIGCSAADISTRVNAVDVVRKLLAWTLPSVSTVDTGVFAAIVEAKQEWEDTADVLPEIVGLVNRSRRVMRINRAIERWSLGEVRNALGRNVHDVLHPQCRALTCDLDLLLDCAFRKLDVETSAAFELADRVSQKDLAVVLNATERPAGTAAEQGWASAALVVSNVTSLRRAERDMKLFNRVLEQRVADRTEQLTGINRALREEVVRRRSAEELLRDSKVQLEALSDRLVTAQEEERKRIAQDLHDSVSQGMSAIKYSLERASLLIQRGTSEQASEVIERAVTSTQGVIDEVRAISMNLRPAALDDLGAVSAIRSFYRSWRSVYNSVSIEEDIAVADRDIPPGIATHVYRAVQESLNNVARHAHAQRVWISIRILDGNLVVMIRDDGVGFEPDTDSRMGGTTSLGLLGLRERTERFGGSCKVATTPGKGTTVHLEWPLTVGVAARHANATLN